MDGLFELLCLFLQDVKALLLVFLLETTNHIFQVAILFLHVFYDLFELVLSFDDNLFDLIPILYLSLDLSAFLPESLLEPMDCLVSSFNLIG